MHKPHDAQSRRAQYLAMESYALSKATYSAKPEDRSYWQTCARFCRHLATQMQLAAPVRAPRSARPAAEVRELL